MFNLILSPVCSVCNCCLTAICSMAFVCMCTCLLPIAIPYTTYLTLKIHNLWQSRRTLKNILALVSILFFLVTKNYCLGQNKHFFSAFFGSHCLWAISCLFFVSKVIASVMLLLVSL